MRGAALAYPSVYNVTYSYTGFQQSQGNNAFPGTQIDADLAGLQASTSALSLFLKSAIRSDGALNNGLVTFDSLAPSLQTAGLAAATAWATATPFVVGSSTVINSNLYRCPVAHTSGVFATDLAAGKWVFVAALQQSVLTGDVTTPGGGSVATTIANNAVTNAKAAQMAAGTIKGNNTGALANAADLTGAQVEQMLLFTQAGTGAVQRPLDSKVKDYWISVKDFGATGNGSTDDTAAIQAAITAAQGTSVNVFFPPGTYKVSSTINITNSAALFGLSRSSVSITWTSTTLNVFSIISDSQVKFEGLSFTGPVNATAGYIVSLTGSATQNLFSTFRDCSFLNGFYQILTTSAADWTIDNCSFGQFGGFGVYVSDTFNPDAGDSAIVNCTFGGSGNTAVCIFQQSSGGLKLLGNKILGGKYGYQLSVAATGLSTIDLIIVGNSIENQTNAGIWLERLSGSNTFGNVVIVGNQLSNMPTGIGCDAVAGWLSRMTITGNQITLATGAGTCISLGSPSSFLVDGNELFGQTGSPLIGVSVGAGATGGQIGVNAYNNLTIPVSNASTSVVATQRTQKGNSSATTNTAQGSFFIGTVAVNFPFTFGATPKVVGNVTSNGFGIGISSITTTGFTAVVWALATAVPVPFDWVAFADA